MGLVSFTSNINESNWFTSLETAKKEAKANNKNILLVFSGSDWCSNCRRLDKSVFQQQEFKNFATKNLVLLSADFPMKKKNRLSKEQTEHNESLAKKYNKKGVFPTVLLLDHTGFVKAEMDASEHDVKKFINEIKKTIK